MKRARPAAIARVQKIVTLRNKVLGQLQESAKVAQTDRLEAVLQLKADIEVSTQVLCGNMAIQ